MQKLPDLYQLAHNSPVYDDEIRYRFRAPTVGSEGLAVHQRPYWLLQGDLVPVAAMRLLSIRHDLCQSLRILAAPLHVLGQSELHQVDVLLNILDPHCPALQRRGHHEPHVLGPILRV